MPTFKRIVCLANSFKPNGRCIAGKELVSEGEIGGWIRPVNTRRGEGLTHLERMCENGHVPSLLDIIDVPLLQAQPDNHQQENWLIEPNTRWKSFGSFNTSNLIHFLDQNPSLWVDGYSSATGTKTVFRCSKSAPSITPFG